VGEVFCQGEVGRERGRQMSRHLDSCQSCLIIFDCLPPPTYYSLGRPFRPAFALSPDSIEKQANALTSQLAERVRTGGSFHSVRDWQMENESLSHTIAIGDPASTPWLLDCGSGYTLQRELPICSTQRGCGNSVKCGGMLSNFDVYAGRANDWMF